MRINPHFLLNLFYTQDKSIIFHYMKHVDIRFNFSLKFLTDHENKILSKDGSRQFQEKLAASEEIARLMCMIKIKPRLALRLRVCG